MGLIPTALRALPATLRRALLELFVGLSPEQGDALLMFLQGFDGASAFVRARAVVQSLFDGQGATDTDTTIERALAKLRETKPMTPEAIQAAIDAGVPKQALWEVVLNALGGNTRGGCENSTLCAFVAHRYERGESW